MEDLLIKAATVIAVGLATFSSFPGTAQQDTPPAQQAAPTTTTQGSAQPNSDDPAMNNAAAALKPVSGELVDKLDAKSAKQGDSVVLKTDQDLTITTGTEMPKGSRLLGHVTSVRPRGDGNENSQIAVQFDRAELMGGQTVSISSVIQSVAPSAEETAGTSTPGGFAATPTSPRAPSGATSSSSGANPSSSGMAQSTTDNNRPGLGSNTTVQSGTTNQAMSANTPGLPPPGSIVAQNGNVAIRTTDVPGVLLANEIHGLPFSNASGVLLGARRDVHLESGTRFVVALAAMPQGAGGGINR